MVHAASGIAALIARRNLAGAAVILAYAILLWVREHLGWHHLLLAALFWLCASADAGARRFLRDWWPIILFWLVYDSMRLYAHLLFPRVAVEAPFRWEAEWFLGPNGVIWPFHFTRWLAEHGDNFWPRVLRGIMGLIYLAHLFLLPIILFLVWYRGERLLFRRLVWTFSALHLMGICLYLAYPAAPPWWVYENGFAGPTIDHSSPAGLSEGSTLSQLFQMSPNRFAAIPSLHAAYPVLLGLILLLHGSRIRWIVLSFAYGAGMWFACVFLNQHYIVDLLIGAVLVFLASPAILLVKEQGDPTPRPT